jgi:hypothetical protein
MARFIKKVGKVTFWEAEPGDPIYSRGWTIGPAPNFNQGVKDDPEKVIEDRQVVDDSGHKPEK